MRYIDEELCREFVFPFIHAQLSSGEPSPQYEEEQRGMGELRKVLDFVRDDRYYPSFASKASYILCSIAGSQYFSNGNKRLGVSLLILFLLLNSASFEDLNEEGYQMLLARFFPKHVWESAPIGGMHSLFLYNLAIVIGNRATWNEKGFDPLKQDVAELIDHLYKQE